MNVERLLHDLLHLRVEARRLAAGDSKLIAIYGSKAQAAEILGARLAEAAFRVRWAISGPRKHYLTDCEGVLGPRCGCLGQRMTLVTSWNNVSCPDCWDARSDLERQKTYRIKLDEVVP